MSGILPLLDSHDLVAPLSDDEAELAAKELAADTGLTIYANSIAARDGRVVFLGRKGVEKQLCVMARESFDEFEGEAISCPHGIVKVCPLSHANAESLRRLLPFTAPKLHGLKVSLGMGDRLGIATPGHVRAIRGSGVAPVLAQQSIREMSRTGRSPEEVMDDATWGVLEEGYRDGFGSDADHLKNEEDIRATFAAGFRLFTIDPGEYVDNTAGEASADALRKQLPQIPWDALEISEEDCRRAFTDHTFRIGHDVELEYDEERLLRAVVKYGRAVAHVVKLSRFVKELAGDEPFEIEMSVDESDSPTTPHEHFYVAHELKRLGVEFISLAPRFIGDFEKGIDYKGDLKAFERSFIQHVQIARYLGPYKLSVHSGSDKFSVYPICAEHAGDLIHVKTAGTSYLEALRTIAEIDPTLFREILAFALGRYDEDKASYHVSADPGSVADPKKATDDELARVLDVNDGRQVLHVTYGSVLNATDDSGELRFRPRMMQALRENEETHYNILRRHMKRHIEPFAD